MRILLIGLNYAPEPSGIGPYTARIAHGLADRGHLVRVLTTFPHYPQWRRTEPRHQLRSNESLGGVHVRRLGHYVPETPTAARRVASELSFGVHAVLQRWADPEVVLCPSPALFSSSLVLARTRAATGIQVQDLYSAGLQETGASALKYRAMARLEGAVVRAATGVSVIHDRFRDRVVQLGVPEGDVRVIRNWTHIEARPSSSASDVRALRQWGSDFVVLHAGAMGRKQGLVNVVRSAKMAAARGLPVRFVLVGDGSERRSLEALADGIKTIEFLDPLAEDDYVNTMHAADALLVNELPALNEMAVPSKLTSYFTTGRPVLAATSVSSTTAEELRSAGAGRRVEPGDPDALLNGIEWFRSHRSEAEALGARGPQYCRRVLDEVRALDAYDEWVHELADRHQAQRG